MRADLQVMEQIDLYLQGKMSVAESAAFQSKMAADPELANMVAEQQLFAQSVTRKAILSEIQLVAAAGIGGGSWYTNPFVGVAGVTVVGGIIAAAVYFNSGSDDNVQSENTIVAEQAGPENNEVITETYISPEGDTVEYTVVEDDDPHTPDQVMFVQPDNQESNPGETVIIGSAAVVDPGDGGGDSHSGDHNVISVPDVDKVERNKMASFPNGNIARGIYIKENVLYPGSARKDGLQGNVKVQFNVDKEGQRSEIRATCFAMFDENDKMLSPTQMTLKQNTAKLFEDKAITTVRTMPSWEPATDSQGNPVVSSVTLNFRFSLTQGIMVWDAE